MGRWAREIMEPWECEATDPARYYQWIADISRLPLFMLAFGEATDAYDLAFARIWKEQYSKFHDDQVWLQSVGNKWAWREEYDVPRFVRHWQSMGATEERVYNGLHLMNRLAAWGIELKPERDLDE